MRLLLFLVFTLTSIQVWPQQELKAQPYFSSLIVENIDTSAAWYCRVLNLTQRNRVDSPERGFKQVVLHSETMMIELAEVNAFLTKENALQGKPAGTRISGVNKIGFIVNDFDAWHEALKHKRVIFFGNIVRDPVSGKRTFLIHDPDKNLVQFFER